MASVRSITNQDSPNYMAKLIRDIIQNLDAVAGIEPIWTGGVVHRGGPHYRLKGTSGPVCLGEDECIVFGRLIEELRPANCFIIGNAFGMSSTFIAKMMEAHGGKSVITLDSKGEGDGQRCYEVAETIRQRMGCRLLTNKVGWSPQDIDSAVEDTSYDLIFIDGDHSHPQVSRDFQGVQHLARDDSVICWHDYWLHGVPESVEAAQEAGFRCVKVNSSCEIVFGTRSQVTLHRITSLYSNIEVPQRQHRPMAYLKLYQALVVAALKRRWLHLHHSWSR